MSQPTSPTHHRARQNALSTARRRSAAIVAFLAATLAVTACGTTEPAVSRTVGAAASDSAPLTPVVVLLDVPETSTVERFASFAFAGDAVECRLDDAPFEPCESPVFFADVGLGVHRFDARPVSDAAGSVSAEWEVVDLWTNPTEDLLTASREPEPAGPNSWRGIFRINCDFSHTSYDDPIVFPGDPGAAHLHRFYGNMSVDHATTVASLYESGSSTCQGDELNASAYWVPALLAPEESTDGWQPVPAVVGGDDVAHEVFYYSGGVDDLDSIQPIPAGLRMIAGDPSATPDDPQSTSVVRWHCQSWASDDATNPRFSATIPACEAPDRVRMDIFFPSCWNGTDLDSDDHQSHMAYPVTASDGEVVCPDSHPVPVVRPSYHYAFGVKPDVYDPTTRSSTGWRLASDTYTVDPSTAGGASLHADWINGWHPSVMEAILEVCIEGGLDCHDGNLANGFRLGDVQEGVQNDLEVVNAGLGHHAGAHDEPDHEGVVTAIDDTATVSATAERRPRTGAL